MVANIAARLLLRTGRASSSAAAPLSQLIRSSLFRAPATANIIGDDVNNPVTTAPVFSSQPETMSIVAEKPSLCVGGGGFDILGWRFGGLAEMGRLEAPGGKAIGDEDEDEDEEAYDDELGDFYEDEDGFVVDDDDEDFVLDEDDDEDEDEDQDEDKELADSKRK